METCPCGSDAAAETCCLPVIKGERIAKTAEETMRSRYTAFALGEIDWILDSHHPETVDEIDRGDVEKWSTESDWLGLTMGDTESGGEADDIGVVNFTARYRTDGTVHDHAERAYFQRHDGIWRFHSVLDPVVDAPELVPVAPSDTVGRNDPCPCGSGRKYKKCCAA